MSVGISSPIPVKGSGAVHVSRTFLVSQLASLTFRDDPHSLRAQRVWRPEHQIRCRRTAGPSELADERSGARNNRVTDGRR